MSSRLKLIGQTADRLRLPAYLVGGAVRDLLLGKETLDWDIVVEGNPAPLVVRLAKRWHARVTAHARFGTFVLTLPGGRHIDFVTARRETYPRPGILPVVEFSDLRDDLFRRDFTLNALALALSGPDRGSIRDFYGGAADLEWGMLRILHDKSFCDDPTRILRLARFAGRGFSIDPATERLAVRSKRYLRYLSAERVREELLAILDENDPYSALALLQKWGVLQIILPGLRLNQEHSRLQAETDPAKRLLLLLGQLPAKRFDKVLDALKLPRNLKRKVDTLRKPPRPAPVLSGNDLIAMGYEPGPLFRKILDTLAQQGITSRAKARRFVFDRFPKKI